MKIIDQLWAASPKPAVISTARPKTGPQVRRIRRIRNYHDVFKSLGGKACTNKVSAILGQHPSSVGASLKEFAAMKPPLVKLAGVLPKTGPGKSQHDWQWLVDDEILDDILEDMF